MKTFVGTPRHHGIGIPQHLTNALEEARNATDCINFARANHCRLDQDKSNMERQGHGPDKSNMERQGHGPQRKDKSTSAFLHDPSLAVLIEINPLDTINPDEDIAPTIEYVLEGTWKYATVNFPNDHVPVLVGRPKRVKLYM